MNTLLLEKKDGIAVVTMNRPKALNALNSEMLKEIKSVVKDLNSDETVKVVIFTGSGKSFVAGADIAEMSELSAEAGREFAQLGQGVFRHIEIMNKPTIAAVNGFALGGGCEISMSCDIRIASNKAKFGQPEVGLGITPGFSGTVRLSRMVGVAKAKELIYTAKLISADEAEKIGLVNQVVEPDELMSVAMDMAKEIASKAPLAVRYSKEAINRSLDVDIDTGNSIEAGYFGLCFATEDQKNGMKAFLNKEKVDFQGK